MKKLFAPHLESETLFHEIEGMEHPFHYRNKVVSPYAGGKKLSGKGNRNSSKSGRNATRYEIQCGMYAPGSHRIISTDQCLIENALAKKIILTIRSLMPKFGIEPYHEKSGSGFLRHALIRVGEQSGEVLVTLVTNEQAFKVAKPFVRELVKRHPQITTVVQNVNTRQTNVILGQEEKTLYGPGFILDELCGLRFRLSSQAFYQVNVKQAELLYRKAVELAGLAGSETLIDAYCGTGTIALSAAKGIDGGSGACRVIGIEENAAAIRDAKNNARHNGVTNAEFIKGDAGCVMSDLAEQGAQVEVVILDPPRAGASEAFLKALGTLRPNKLVYVSCNPETQARDVSILKQQGYSLREIQPIDMFPHTEHVESIVLLKACDTLDGSNS